MQSLKARVAFSIFIVALAAVASAQLLFPVKTNRSDLKAAHLPMQIGSWYGREVEVEQYVRDILETDDVVQRNYNSADYAGAYVQMAIVYSPDNRRVAHPPEVCYTGAGWEMTSKEIVQPDPALPPFVRLVMAHGQNKDVILYCYKSGKDITANYYQQQWNIVYNQISKQSTASALIRFSSRIVNDEAETQERILAFTREMMPLIKDTLND